jgi:hypothetical protein
MYVLEKFRMLDLYFDNHLVLVDLCINCIDNSIYFLNSSINYFSPYIYNILINFFIYINLNLSYVLKLMFMEKNLLSVNFTLFNNFINDMSNQIVNFD